MDQPRKVAKPDHGQLKRETKCPCRCIRGKYILCSAVCIFYISGTFLIWVQYSRARFTAVYAYNMRDYSGIATHYVL